jgi:ABC-2 type transport system ATP-binding protein
MMDSTAIELENVSRRFNDILAVDDVTFSVRSGSICAVLGGNGAGKTSLLSMLPGLLLPTAGRLSVLGCDMLRRRYRVLCRMNFSSPYVDLRQRLTVRENPSVYARLYSVRQFRQRMVMLAGQLEIEDYLDRVYGTRSAGQKTRAALAKALLNQPDVLLLDEPSVPC